MTITKPDVQKKNLNLHQNDNEDDNKTGIFVERTKTTV